MLPTTITTAFLPGAFVNETECASALYVYEVVAVPSIVTLDMLKKAFVSTADADPSDLNDSVWFVAVSFPSDSSSTQAVGNESPERSLLLTITLALVTVSWSAILNFRSMSLVASTRSK